MKSKLRVFALGGLGEIGLNLTVIEYGDDILIVDCGVLFPDLYWMGLDIVIPDFTYLIENQHKIKGLVITHGHEDHIGAIPFLLKFVKIPIIYSSKFAARLIEEKSEEHGVLNKLLTYTVEAGEIQRVGLFDVEFIHITHSTLESFALAITTPVGVIVHSGDFKFDEKPYAGPATNKKRLKEIGKLKPLLLLSDSTNSEKCGHSGSESSISQELEKLISETTGAAVVALFASNVHRIQQLIDIAAKQNRKVFLSGRSMFKYIDIAIKEKYLPVKLSSLKPIEDIKNYPRSEVLVLSTGSQGEARSSLLRLANNENTWLKLTKGDAVILSSRNIPGNERAISYVVNQIFRLGATVHYEEQKHIHVSGHAYQEEQVEMIDLIRPRFFIPVHGEYRHLVLHGKTAQTSGVLKENVAVIENGQVWEFDPVTNKAEKKNETIPTGRRWYFHENSGTLDAPEIKERRTAAKGGIVIVDCLLDSKQKRLRKPPHVTLKGFLCSETKRSAISSAIVKTCAEAFEQFQDQNPDELTKEQSVALAARRVVKRALDVRPLVVVNFLLV
jgi:ribonuclease J